MNTKQTCNTLFLGFHKTPAVSTPTLEELDNIASDHNIQISSDDMTEYQREVGIMLSMMTRLDRLAEPMLPVKYPRTPGYRPGPEENVHNAW